MKILAIDTSAAVATAAVFADGRLLSECAADPAKKHAETVIPIVEEALEKAGQTLSEMDCFAADIGPGSFTGIRIGVCAVNAFGYALNKKVIPVNALEALAYPYRGEGRPVVAMIDARNGNGYTASFNPDFDSEGPEAKQVKEILAALPENAIVTGDVETERFRIPEERRMPSAGTVALIAAEHAERAAETVVPLYLRASQAERMREKK